MTDISGMFGYSSNLETIYINPDKWSSDKFKTLQADIFSDCNALVGRSKNGHRTAYADNPYEYYKAKYARVDVDDNNRGLFTDYSLKPSGDKNNLNDSLKNKSLNSFDSNYPVLRSMTNQENEELSRQDKPTDRDNITPIISKDEYEAVLNEADSLPTDQEQIGFEVHSYKYALKPMQILF